VLRPELSAPFPCLHGISGGQLPGEPPGSSGVRDGHPLVQPSRGECKSHLTAMVLKRFESVVQLQTCISDTDVLQDGGYRLPLLKGLEPSSIDRFILPQSCMEFFRSLNEVLSFPDGSITTTVHAADPTAGQPRGNGPEYAFAGDIAKSGARVAEPLLDGSGWDVDYAQPYRNGPLDLGFDAFFGIAGSLDMPP